jgi:hypothetical protein
VSSNDFSRITAQMVDFGGFSLKDASLVMLMAQGCADVLPNGQFDANGTRHAPSAGSRSVKF